MSAGMKRVMIVEDNRAMSRVLAFNFARAGFEAVTAVNGKDAWEQLQRMAVDAIVTDQQMPEMEGLECCRRLRTLPAHRDTPVIMLTAKAFELDAQQVADEFGIAAVLGKPFSPHQLVKIVEDTLTVNV